MTYVKALDGLMDKVAQHQAAALLSYDALQQVAYVMAEVADNLVEERDHLLTEVERLCDLLDDYEQERQAK